MTSNEARSEATAATESTEDFVDRMVTDILGAGLEAAAGDNGDLAAHVATMLTAVAATIQDDDHTFIDLAAGMATIEHKCECLLEAAIFLLATGSRIQGKTTRDVIASIPTAVRLVARSTLT